jgi:hypothetical protein
MKTRSLLSLFVAGSVMFSTTLLAQTSTMTGKVLAVSSNTITVQEGREVWDIKRTPRTSTTGTLKVGATITITYNTPDAQKKEGPTTTTNPTPTPPGQ